MKTKGRTHTHGARKNPGWSHDTITKMLGMKAPANKVSSRLSCRQCSFDMERTSHDATHYQFGLCNSQLTVLALSSGVLKFGATAKFLSLWIEKRPPVVLHKTSSCAVWHDKTCILDRLSPLPGRQSIPSIQPTCWTSRVLRVRQPWKWRKGAGSVLIPPWRISRYHQLQ